MTNTRQTAPEHSEAPISERTEYCFRSESKAHTERREMINRGELVSLIAFDPARNEYVFNTYHQD